MDHPERERILQLRNEISDAGALAEVKNILIRSGAVSYCLYQILNKAKVAREILANSFLAYREGIDTLLTEITDPVKKLFSVTDIVERGTLSEFFPSC